MTHPFLAAMSERISSGLQRRSITKASKWATTFRVMSDPFPGKWSFKHHPWTKEMHDSTAELNVGQKSAQMGYTETVLNLAFYHIDVKGVDCLYVLPAKTPDSSDFSSGRFDKALELSDHLKNLFSDVKNIGHKRAGTANMYIRGSKSRSGLKSIPVGFIVLDELDEMDQDNIELALQRTTGQVTSQAWMISTPTLNGKGINHYFNDSTQEHFNFKCPGCSRWTELIFPECLKIIGENQRDPRIEESHLICKDCKVVLPHATKTDWLDGAKWVPSFTDRSIRGFHVNQLYSCTVKPPAIAKAVFLAHTDPTAETELYNSRLGLPHAVSGSQITDENLDDHTEAYGNGKQKANSGYITMGIDVGNHIIHYEVCQYKLGQMVGGDFHTDARCRVLEIGKVAQFPQLDLIMRKWNVHSAVIDANPERRSALQFANRFYGIVRLCIYGQGISGKDVKASATEEHLVLVDRTSWLDMSLSRFRTEDAIQIPYDTPAEYKEHVKTLVRVYKKDKDGNPYGYYDNGGHDDHYAHSRNYAEIALHFAALVRTNTSIQSPL